MITERSLMTLIMTYTVKGGLHSYLSTTWRRYFHNIKNITGPKYPFFSSSRILLRHTGSGLRLSIKTQVNYL